MKIITIAGNVAKDSTLRRTGQGEAVLGFSVGVNGRNDKTLWFDVSVFGKRGEALEPHVKKGTKVTVVGDLDTREHEGKTYLQVAAREIDLQGGNRADSEDHQGPRSSGKREAAGSRVPLSNDLDDDVPFEMEWR